MIDMGTKMLRRRSLNSTHYRLPSESQESITVLISIPPSHLLPRHATPCVVRAVRPAHSRCSFVAESVRLHIFPCPSSPALAPHADDPSPDALHSLALGVVLTKQDEL